MADMKEYYEVIGELRSKLVPYLAGQGVEIKGSLLNCINPDHEDRNPSCSIGGQGTDPELFNCFSCLPPWENVRTPKGYTAISNIKIGDEVYCDEGVGTVFNVIKKLKSSTLLDICLGNCFRDRVELTEDHTVFSVTDMVNKVPYLQTEETREYGIKFYSKLKGLSLPLKYKNSINIEETRAGDLKKGDYLVMPVFNTKDIHTESHDYVEGIGEVNPDIMWLLGFYAAEGSTYRGGITFTINRAEIEYKERIIRILSDMGYKSSVYEYDYKPNTTNVSCSSTKLQRVMEKTASLYSHNKKAPDGILMFSKDNQRAWLNGVFDGDAHKDYLCVTSKSLVLTSKQIAVNLKIPFSTGQIDSYVGNDGIHRMTTYWINLLAKENIRCFYDVDSTGKEYCFQIVREIRVSSNDESCEEVWDITVDSENNSSSFLSNHFMVHNCGVAGDIFHAAHLLENLPLRGAEFFSITLKTLADRFNIAYNPKELDEGTKDKLQLMSAYHDASVVINSFVVRDWEEDVQHVRMIKERDISLDSVKEFMIGAIPSKQEYIEAMNKRGWSTSYLRTNELIDDEEKKDKIFDAGKIIMTICDKNNNAIAFVSRMHNWTGKEDGAKYVNSGSSIIYKKAETLYGYNLSKNNIKTKANKQNRPLYIVEGYIDVITLRQAGFKNVAGLGSATFNPEIFGHLGEKSWKGKPGFELTDIVLALDGDETGIRNTWKALDDLAKRPDVVVRVKEIPQVKGLSDPDEIIRKNGLKFFKDLREFTPFRWLLDYNKKNSETSEAEFVRSACEQIANEASPISRSEMASDLAGLTTEFTKSEIMAEVASINNVSQAMLEQELHAIMDDMYRRKSGSRVDLIDLMSETLSRCKSKAKEYKQNKGDVVDVYKQQILDTEEMFRKAGDLTGFKLNSYPELERALDGFPKDECMISVAAPANIGKSTWMREISWDIAKSNKDAVVIYMSIDDSAKDVLQALVSKECGVARKYVAKFSKNTEDIKDAIILGWDKVKKQSNYIVADSTQGNTLTDLYNHVEYARRNFNDSNLIVFLDNFHKLNPGTTSNLREKFVDLSQQIKDLTQIENIPVVMTVEMRKKMGYVSDKTEPKLDDVSESGKMVYDSKLVFLMRQRLHDNLETPVFWNRSIAEGDLTKMPYLEAIIAKNKHSESKKWLGYKFETDKSILRECDYGDIKELADGQSDKNNPRGNTFNV